MPTGAVASRFVIGSAVSAWGAGTRLALAALAAVALLPAATNLAPAMARPLVTGVSGIGDYTPITFSQTRTTGARFVRLAVYWRNVAPKTLPSEWQPKNPADPHYDWSYIDQGVTEAVKAGLTPLLLVDGAPAWAQRCKAPAIASAGDLCDPAPAALAAFATAAARRYSGTFGGLPRVQYWQALNEPNLTLFFFPQFNTQGRPLSPGLYRALINAFYAGVKSVDRTNLVLAAGLGPTAVPGLTIGPLRFTRELLCMRGQSRPRPKPGKCGGGVRFDIFDIHPYTTGGPDHQGGVNDVQLGDLGKLTKLLRAAERAGRIKGQFRRTPLWATEFSWDSAPPDPGGLRMRILTRWAAEAMHRVWSAGISNFFWYSLRDSPRVPNRPFSETLQSGLYFRGPTPEEDRPKDVLYAFRFPFVAYPRDNGLLFWGRTPDSSGGEVVLQIHEQQEWRTLAVSLADESGIFQGVVPTHYGANEVGAVRAEYRGESSVPFSMRPVEDFRQPPFG